ncbi:hypothetical protein [Parvibaculum sp.]|uniref:hypothetical protein n=1 Tax=Parvibaculum sp. TaxID=2024848 RepID=UPI001D5B45AB|nr:hypothetical protein [Parvibaculum sp.]MBX3490870.1 hypothetical protein [Parvibaculum sp.]
MSEIIEMPPVRDAAARRHIEAARMSPMFFPLFVESALMKGDTPADMERNWGVPEWVIRQTVRDLEAKASSAAKRAARRREVRHARA